MASNEPIIWRPPKSVNEPDEWWPLRVVRGFAVCNSTYNREWQHLVLIEPNASSGFNLDNEDDKFAIFLLHDGPAVRLRRSFYANREILERNAKHIYRLPRLWSRSGK